MSPKREWTDYLRDILTHAGKAEQFVAGVEFEAFRANDEKVLAVIRALEIVGEAARQVPSSLRTRYPEIPWEDAIGMRDKLVHEYFGVDLEVVWRTVHDDLPPLRRAVARMLEDVERETKGG
jgi:uncharacterized protein with HEPN domain